MIRRVLTTAVPMLAGAAVIAAHRSWLGWHDRDYFYDPAVHAMQGPYHPSQVVGLALTLAVIAGAGGWLMRPLWTALAMTLVLVVVWSMDAAYSPPGSGIGANLWPVGAVFLAVGGGIGLAVAAYIGFSLRWLVKRWRPSVS